MSTIMIHDLPQSRDLDRGAMSAVRGGLRSLDKLPGADELHGPFAIVDIHVDQQIVQFQNIEVLKNIGSIGANLPALNIIGRQRASTGVVIIPA